MPDLTDYILEKSGMSEQQIEHYRTTFRAARILKDAGIGCDVKQYFTSSPTEVTCRIEVAMPASQLT